MIFQCRITHNKGQPVVAERFIKNYLIRNVTLKNCLIGATNVAKNSDKSKLVNSSSFC